MDWLIYKINVFIFIIALLNVVRETFLFISFVKSHENDEEYPKHYSIGDRRLLSVAASLSLVFTFIITGFKLW